MGKAFQLILKRFFYFGESFLQRPIDFKPITMSSVKKDFLKELHRDLSLTHEQSKLITEAYILKGFKKGEFILKEGSTSNSYYIIINGLVRSFAVDTTGQDITTDFFSTKEMILAPASFLLRAPSKENIQSLNQCICLQMSFVNFQNLFSTIDTYRNWARTSLVLNYAQLKNRSIAQITDSAKKRYLDLKTIRPAIIESAPLKHIATYLGMTDSSLSRIRKEIANEEQNLS